MLCLIVQNEPAFYCEVSTLTSNFEQNIFDNHRTEKEHKVLKSWARRFNSKSRIFIRDTSWKQISPRTNKDFLYDIIGAFKFQVILDSARFLKFWQRMSFVTQWKPCAKFFVTKNSKLKNNCTSAFVWLRLLCCSRFRISDDRRESSTQILANSSERSRQTCQLTSFIAANNSIDLVGTAND